MLRRAKSRHQTRLLETMSMDGTDQTRVYLGVPFLYLDLKKGTREVEMNGNSLSLRSGRLHPGDERRLFDRSKPHYLNANRGSLDIYKNFMAHYSSNRGSHEQEQGTGGNFEFEKPCCNMSSYESVSQKSRLIVLVEQVRHTISIYVTIFSRKR